MSDKLERFITLLRSMFELDKSDLDFGIYRIMNIRKSKIDEFLNTKLQRQVASTLSAAAVDDNANIAELETDVYSSLYNFFNRYYDDGDFISKRRYKEGVYAIPYEGEEVKLYWANHDQYYIKTSENFKDYSFIVEDKTIHFKLIDATTEVANNKENSKSKREFMLCENNFIEEKDNELFIYLNYDIPQDKDIKYKAENISRIKAAIQDGFKHWYFLLEEYSTIKGNKKSYLEKHYESYVAKNSFDYFIHKDLRSFLSRELDFFIKSEVMHLDDLDTDNEVRVSAYLSKVKAIKRVGRVIIDFLAQIENFQKKLWLKKKFIVETNWCITLDKIDESFYPEIIANDMQIKEWCEIFAIDEISGDLLTSAFALPLTIDFLKQNDKLVLDTANFSDDFKDRLIATIDNIDEETNGLLIHSENFQALSLLQAKYKEKIKCVYIDPPYNTGGDGFIYKDGYSHSSWLAMMKDRLKEASQKIRDDTAIFISIDDKEVTNARKLCDEVFGNENFVGCLHWKKKKQPSFLHGHIAGVMEYIIVYAKNKLKLEKLSIEVRNDENTRIDNATNSTAERHIQAGIRVKLCDGIINAGTYKNKSMETEYLEDVHVKNGRTINSFNAKAKFRNDQDNIDNFIKNDVMFITKNYGFRRDLLDEELQRKKAITDLLLDWGDNQDSDKEMTSLFGDNNLFGYPKPSKLLSNIIKSTNKIGDNLVLDFFAGSGTTGHAVINLNREDGGNRKYILVEMGEYFNTVTKPRIKKVIYSAGWKDGKPTKRDSGSSHIMKYIRLESYEDTLQNIMLDDEKHKIFEQLDDDYLIQYMLDTESENSLLNIDSFKHPFEYTLNITEKNQSKARVIDLCETFNYIIGLSVARQTEVKRYNAIKNEKGEYEGAVKLEANLKGEYAFKRYEGTLRTGEKTLVIWRQLTDNLLADNAALDAFFAKSFIDPKDREFDLIYINGDNNIENLRTDGEIWKINLTELEMKKRMFE